MNRVKVLGEVTLLFFEENFIFLDLKGNLC